jgi:5-methylcytosine-specific restriction enzyme A
MLALLVGKAEISAAQNLLQQRLFEQLPQRDNTYVIGYQGGNIEASDLHADHRIWFLSSKSGERYWNAFGLADRLNISTSNSITVEINSPFSGENGRVAGLFARGDDGSLYLLHRGKIGGGKSGIGKQAFLEWSNLTLTSVQTPDGRTFEAILIGKLDSRSLSKDVARFVYAVANFKATISNQELVSLPNDELERIADKKPRKPKTILVETTVFVRDQTVSEYAKRRANGRCDLCGENAPFSDSQGRPYLECHHIVWLANGGLDTIDNTCALCPNCHRKMHVVGSKKDIKILLSAASRRIANAA